MTYNGKRKDCDSICQEEKTRGEEEERCAAML